MRPDDVQIHLGDERSRLAVRAQPSPVEDRTMHAAAVGAPDRAARPIYIREAALRGIEAHAATSPDAEVGGVLLGGACEGAKGGFLLVEAHLAARNAGERRSELTFTHETWQALNAEREASHPEMNIVGWYHTHPGLGVFLSDRDLFIHRNFFADETSIALVVDPVAGTRGFFAWEGGQVRPAAGYLVYGARGDRKAIDALAAPPPARTERAASGVRVVFQEPCVNLYRAIPAPLRRVLGITDPATAPRLSVKNVIIVALLAMIAWQGGSRAALRGLRARDAADHAAFGAAFIVAGDWQEAAREYRRAAVLRPRVATNYLGEMRALALAVRLSDRPAASAFEARASAIVDEAARAGGRPVLDGIAAGLPRWLDGAPESTRAALNARVQERLREIPPPRATAWDRFRAYLKDQFGG